MVTGVGVLLSSILGLHYAKDINFIFFSFKFSVPLFSHRRVTGSISCTHQYVWWAKNALQLRYT